MGFIEFQLLLKDWHHVFDFYGEAFMYLLFPACMHYEIPIY